MHNTSAKVAVVMGGFSSEREISLISGNAVLKSLQQSGINATYFDPKETPIANIKDYDIAVLMTHGKYGEDGIIQGALELLKVPYTGSGVMASSLAMDKYRTKLVWQALGVPTPKSQYVERDGFDYTQFILKIQLPVVVKPVCEGSTMGLSKVYNLTELDSAIQLAFTKDNKVLIEELIEGDEFTVTVFNGAVLPTIKIEAPDANYDYTNKYFTDDTKYLCPYDLGSLQEQVNQYAKLGYAAVGARGIARLDFMVNKNKEVFFLEINTLPGMTSHSLVPMAFNATGIDFNELCLLILNDAGLNR